MLCNELKIFSNRISLNFGVGVLAFLLGVSTSAVMHHSRRQADPSRALPVESPACDVPNDLQEILSVSYCDLMSDPEDYDGRLVRLEATMHAGRAYEPMFDKVTLAAPPCESKALMVNDRFHLTSRTCPAILRKLDSVLMGYYPYAPAGMAKVRVVGIFSSPKITTLTGGQLRMDSERFTIVSVEYVSPINDDN